MGFFSTLRGAERGLVKKDSMAREGVRRTRLLETVAMSNDRSSMPVGKRECGGGAETGIVAFPAWRLCKVLLTRRRASGWCARVRERDECAGRIVSTRSCVV